MRKQTIFHQKKAGGEKDNFDLTIKNLEYTCNEQFRYNTKLHKKMYKIDTRLTLKLSPEVSPYIAYLV